MDMFRPNDLVIDDTNYLEHVEPFLEGERLQKGLIPRNYSTHPIGCYSRGPKFDIPTIPRNEWSSRIKDMVQSESRLSDLRLTGNNGDPIPSVDQNGRGYCWAHSPVVAMLLLRAKAGLPYVGLSAYAVACIIKNYRDQGGWGAQGLDLICERGVPSYDYWPAKSVKQSNDNEATWVNAKMHRITEGFMDMQAAQYDRKMTFDQKMTCLLLRIPTIDDFNWWGHSICGMDPIEFDTSLSINDNNRWGSRNWNSWADSYGDRGTVVLRGSKAIPDGCTAPRVATGSLT